MTDIVGTIKSANDTLLIGSVNISGFPIHSAMISAPKKRIQKKKTPVAVRTVDDRRNTRLAPYVSPRARRSDTSLDTAMGKPAVARTSRVEYRGYTCW